MLSPSGPSGIVEGSGGFHLDVETATPCRTLAGESELPGAIDCRREARRRVVFARACSAATQANRPMKTAMTKAPRQQPRRNRLTELIL